MAQKKKQSLEEKKAEFDNLKVIKEEQMSNDDINLFSDDKPKEVSPTVQQSDEEDNPQLEDMPDKGMLDLDAENDVLPDELITVDVDGDIYEGKRNSGDKTITLTLKDDSESAADKLNIGGEMPNGDELNNNIGNENMGLNMENKTKDPFSSKRIIFEGIDGDDEDFMRDEESHEEHEANETPAEEANEEINDAEESIDDNIPDDAIPVDGDDIDGEDGDIDIDDINWDEFEDFDVSEFDTDDEEDFSLHGDDEPIEGDDINIEEEGGDENFIPDDVDAEKEILNDVSETDQEEPGWAQRMSESAKKVHKENKVLREQVKTLSSQINQIQLFTEKVKAIDIIDNNGKLGEEDRKNLRNLVNEAKNSTEIKTILNTFSILKESLSKKNKREINLEDVMRKNGINEDIINQVRGGNKSPLNENASWMSEMAGLND